MIPSPKGMSSEVCSGSSRSIQTHLFFLERKVKMHVDVNLPVTAWLPGLVAAMYKQCHVCEDGKTAYERPEERQTQAK